MIRLLRAAAFLGATFGMIAAEAQDLSFKDWAGSHYGGAATAIETDEFTGLSRLTVDGSAQNLSAMLVSNDGWSRLSLPDDLKFDLDAVSDLLRTVQGFPVSRSDVFKIRAEPQEAERSLAVDLVSREIGAAAKIAELGPIVDIESRTFVSVSVNRPWISGDKTKNYYIGYGTGVGSIPEVEGADRKATWVLDPESVSGRRPNEDALRRWLELGDPRQKYEPYSPKLGPEFYIPQGSDRTVIGSSPIPQWSICDEEKSTQLDLKKDCSNAARNEAGTTSDRPLVDPSTNTGIACDGGLVNHSDPEKDCLASVGMIRVNYSPNGSGVLIDKDGLFFLTAAHTLEDNSTIQVVFGNDKNSTVVYYVERHHMLGLGHKDSDLALLKLKPEQNWDIKRFATPVLEGEALSDLGRYLHYGAGFGNAYISDVTAGTKGRGVLARCPKDNNVSIAICGDNNLSDHFKADLHVKLQAQKVKTETGDYVSSPCFGDSGSPVFVSTRIGQGYGLAVSAIIIMSGGADNCDGSALAADLSKPKVRKALLTAIEELGGAKGRVFANRPLNQQTALVNNGIALLD